MEKSMDQNAHVTGGQARSKHLSIFRIMKISSTAAPEID
jgi:hypothetical protein